MLHFIRSDLAQLTAYSPHPGGTTGQPVTGTLDRLDTNENPLDLPTELKQKLAWVYQHEMEANRYPDGSHGALKAAIAAYVNESTPAPCGITPEQISVGNGSDELIRSILIATCLRGEGAILVANPTFSMYAITAHTLGIPVVTVGRSDPDFAIDLTAAQSALEQTHTPPIRVVFVVHPNSPTANALTSAELDWLRQIPSHVLVVIDEAYFEFSQTSVVDELAHHPNWVILRTFSKAFRLASHRVGYAIANPDLIAILEKIRLPYNLPAFSLAAAQLVMEHRQQLLADIAEILAERDRLGQGLTQHPRLRVWPSQANFIYVRLRDAVDGELSTLCQELKRRGTLVRHISDGLRITIGTAAENQRTLAHLQATLAVR